MSYPDTIRFLYGLGMFGLKLGLDNTRRLADVLGNPQGRLRFIHIAGTNGKGSVAAMLESIYRAAGLRVGLYTSPHLVSFRERIQVNRHLISEADVVRLVAQLRAQSELTAASDPQPQGTRTKDEHEDDSALRTAHSPTPTPRTRDEDESALCHLPSAICHLPSPPPNPTFFELVTVIALQYFAEQQCDLVVWETGLGGRLDSTNIVTPLASVITNIGLDHQQWLGGDLRSIAAEKAGIIKPGVPVITAAAEPDALAVIQETSRLHQSPLTRVTVADTTQPPLDAIHLPLLGGHQRVNAATALATVRVLRPQWAVDEQTQRTGLQTVSWPGRLQLIEHAPGRKILLDGAHNPEGAEALRTVLARDFAGIRPVLILGILKDKDWERMCDILAPLAGTIWCVPVKSDRGGAPEHLAAACRRAHPAATVHSSGSLAAALATAESEPFVLVAGSLYLIGEAMQRLHIHASPDLDETVLNEWR